MRRKYCSALMFVTLILPLTIQANMTLKSGSYIRSDHPESLWHEGDIIPIMFSGTVWIRGLGITDPVGSDLSFYRVVCAPTLDELTVKVNNYSSDSDFTSNCLTINAPYLVNASWDSLGGNWAYRLSPIEVRVTSEFKPTSGLLKVFCGLAPKDTKGMIIQTVGSIGLFNVPDAPFITGPSVIKLPECGRRGSSLATFPVTLSEGSESYDYINLSAKIIPLDGDSNNLQLKNEAGEFLTDPNGVNLNLLPGERTNYNLVAEFNCEESPGEYTWKAEITLNVQ